MLIATRNAHKVGEIRAILGSNNGHLPIGKILNQDETRAADIIRKHLASQFQFLTLQDFPQAPKVIEDADTFAGNATKKAVELAKWLASQSRNDPKDASVDFVLADDSGLEVDALNGAPGVHSARFAALEKHENSPDAANNAKLLKLLANVPLAKRTARFRCVIALVPVPEAKAESASPVCYADEFEARTFDGTCEGHIQLTPAGGGGFGYDPLFVPDGFKESFAELGEDVKNQLSHRGKALEKLKGYFGNK